MPAALEASEVFTAMPPKQGDPALYADLLKRFGVPEMHHVEFTCFIETGEASPQFAEFLDENKTCQEAVEQAFLRRMNHVRQILQVLTNGQEAAVAN
jgi:hypothetical protein